MSLSLPPRLHAIWQRLPFRAMLLLVLFLFIMKVDEEADILYVTDQADQALPMDAVFRTGSGTSKKMYKKELNALTKTAGRKLEDATPEDRAAAGRAVMTTIVERIRPKAMPAGVTHLRFYRKTFRMEDGGLAHLEPERLAEFPVPTP
jgi:hypothetical protein